MIARPARLFATFLASLTVCATLFAQGTTGGIQMPDPRQMSGVPLPVGDVAPGTVSVRLIRGALDKPIIGQTVTITGPSTSATATTNDAGRAEFTGLASGTRIKAVAVVAGERLESQEFQVPATGGIRLMLVATDPEVEKRAADDRKLAQGPAQPGMVVLGDQTRLVFELGDDGLNAFNIMQILNTARTPVQPAQAVIFDMPPEGEGIALLEGSSPQASVQGKRIIVTGPFAPGMTLVQFSYSLPYSGDRLTVHQTVPVPLSQLTVLAQKVGEMHLDSPQVPQHRDMSAEGRTYIIGRGPALKAGDVVTLEFTGLPHNPAWPRNVALALAVMILAGGAWAGLQARQAGTAQNERRQKLEAKRDRLFNELISLEEQQGSSGANGERYSNRRRELVSALERVYAEMDEAAAA